ncbi:MAG: DNA translocase FtsK [Bacilli bacterium]|nr:DNA translocase FtsK [Bacilli bacterium]
MSRRKKKTKIIESYQVELSGLILILISIIGLGRFGIFGEFISSLSALLVGKLYAALLICSLIIGLFMIFKREAFDFFTSKLFGLYILFMGALVFFELNYINDAGLTGSEMVKEVINSFIPSLKDMTIIHGGGLIGSLLTWGNITLFDVKGTEIVMIILMICGFVMFTGISIMDIISKVKEKSKKVLNTKIDLKGKEEIKKVEEKYERDNKIVVSSYDDLVHMNEDKEAKEEREVKEAKEESIAPMDSISSESYGLPPITLLNKPPKNKDNNNQQDIKNNVEILTQVLKDFGIESKIVSVNIGPSVTQYELEILGAIKLSKILGLNREISLALAAKDVRIEAPIPGKRTVGIEIPNRSISMVTVREILETVPSSFSASKLLVTLGKNIMGKPVYAEINKTPHLLVAGATGSGKSVCINSFIISILMRTRPDEVKLVLVDPKKVELSVYNGVPHLLAPVVTDPKRANVVLKKIVSEMERRYDLFEKSGTKNIAGYNEYIDKYNATSENKQPRIPYIVVIIDELADLMLVAAKEVEDSIMRITQMARAAGIHLIVATQRPSTDVITGVVKANIPSRIAFEVATQVDSRTILDMGGAEKLLGKGDMLFAPMGENTPIRVQGTFVSEEEIKKVVDFTVKQQIARYDETLSMTDEEMRATTMVDDSPSSDAYEEPLYNEIVKFVVDQGKASASLLQRRFRLGYNRAARIIDLLEERGIIGPNNGSKPRDVLVKVEKEEE